MNPNSTGVPTQLLGRSRVGSLLTVAAFDWSIIALAWSIYAGCHRPWLYPVYLLIAAGRLHALGVVLHDAVHMRRLRKTVAVRLLEAVAGYPIGTTLDAMRYHHLRHHRDSARASDPYGIPFVNAHPALWWLALPRFFLLLPFWMIRPIVGVVAAVVPSWRNVYGHVWLQDRSGRDLRRHPEVIRCAREEVGQLIFAAVIVALYLHAPGLMLHAFAVPAEIAGVLAGYRLLTEHTHELTESTTFESTVRTTVTHGNGNWLERLLVYPHNIGYHAVHHLHPQVSWNQLPVLHRWYDRAGVWQ